MLNKISTSIAQAVLPSQEIGEILIELNSALTGPV